MNGLFGFNLGLGGLAMLSDAETRSISAENPTGARGSGAMAEPDAWNMARKLGKGWKVKPATGLEPYTEKTLADIEGPGVIQHIWITADAHAHCDVILRFYWDDEETPSVEVPLGDFFANGHGQRYVVNSVPVCVNPNGGLNCYWPMPFRKRARVTAEGQVDETMWGFFYQITYSLTQVPEDAAYFHAQWRRAITDIEAPDHVILDGCTGPGHYVGTVLSWQQRSNGWWGEGEIKFYMDGDTDYPTICGTGVEDYVGGAWGFDNQTYSTPYMGYPYYRREPGDVPQHGLYRWHILDPIRFKSDLRITLQAIGHNAHDNTYRFLDDDIASVAYWYQREPHGPFPQMPSREARWSR